MVEYYLCSRCGCAERAEKRTEHERARCYGRRQIQPPYDWRPLRSDAPEVRAKQATEQATAAEKTARAVKRVADLARRHDYRILAQDLLIEDHHCRPDVWSQLQQMALRHLDDPEEPSVRELARSLSPADKRDNDLWLDVLAEELGNWYGCATDSICDP